MTNIVDLIVSFALFINAILFVPQAIKIYKEKNAESLSLTTFIGFLLIQLAIIIHGMIKHDTILIFGYLLSIISCGTVVALAIYYRRKGNALTNKIDFKEILEQLPAHVYWKNKDGVCLGCSRSNWEDFGLTSLSDYVGKTDYDLFPKEQADKLRQIDLEVIRTGELRIAEEISLTRNGKDALYLSHKMPLRDHKQEIIGIIGVSLDITEAKKAQIEKLEMLENIIALMPGHVYWLGSDGIYLGCNNNQAISAGLSSHKEIVGKRNRDLPWNLNANHLPEALDKINMEVMQKRQTIVVEEPAILPNGQKAMFLSNKVPLINRDNKVIGMVGISIDITELKDKEMQLTLAKEAAESANRAKSEFLYNMRHDLRTPFSGILGISEYLKKHETDSSKAECLNYIYDSAKILLNHLNEILEYIQFENGDVPILDKPFNLEELLADIHAMMLPAAKDKGLDLTTIKDQDLPTNVIGDYFRTQRILINLLANGIKFTESGYVKLIVNAINKNDNRVIVRFLIEDTGIGIPKDKQDIIFERFNRLTSSYSGIYPGKGFGLRMVKRFLDEIDGDVYLRDKESPGTIFEIQIPYKQPLLS